MNNSLDKKPSRQPVFTGVFNWSQAHLYLSLANVLAAVIAVATTIEVLASCIHMNQLEPGVLAVPFIVCLDILFIVLAASLFVRRPSGFCLYLGFVAILIVPQVGSIVVIDVLRHLSGVNNVSGAATSRLTEGSISLVLSLLCFWDILSRMREAQHSKTTS